MSACQCRTVLVIPVDYSTTGPGIARNYLERHLLIEVRREPIPLIQPSHFKAQRLDLQPPYPPPETLVALNGEPPPDRGSISDWPYPEE